METRPIQHNQHGGKSILFPISAAGISDVGRVRANNEDNYRLGLDDGIFIVSDGMGGHESGEIAARIVVELLPRLLNQALAARRQEAPHTAPDYASLVRTAVHELNELVGGQARRELGMRGMGATLALAWVTGPGRGVCIANVGDSRIYYLHKNMLTQVSRDHSIVALLVQSGEIPPAEAAGHPARGQLYRYIGMAEEAAPEVNRINPQPGDLLLLCSDGLTDHLDDAQIHAILVGQHDLLAACHALAEAANTQGGKDNITAMLIRWDSD